MYGSLGAVDWGSFFRNTVTGAISTWAGGQGGAPAVTAPAAIATPAAAATAAIQKQAAQESSTMSSMWPIIAVGGVGVLALGAVLLMKAKKKS